MNKWKVQVYSSNQSAWAYLHEKVDLPDTKCDVIIVQTREEFWDLVQDCFDANFAIKIYKPRDVSDVDVVLMLDSHKGRFKQR